MGVITSKDPEGLKKKLNAELANGRLAMMAIIGMFFQDGLTGTAWGDWSAWPESKFWASAFESELGVQAPVGFWDPLGFSSEGNVDAFKRRRASEIKHGRQQQRQQQRWQQAMRVGCEHFRHTNRTSAVCVIG